MLIALVAVVFLLLLVKVLTGGMNDTAKGINGLTGLLKRLNTWLDSKLEAQRKGGRE